jgi:hypothetical protein
MWTSCKQCASSKYMKRQILDLNSGFVISSGYALPVLAQMARNNFSALARALKRKTGYKHPWAGELISSPSLAALPEIRSRGFRLNLMSSSLHSINFCGRESPLTDRNCVDSV